MGLRHDRVQFQAEFDFITAAGLFVPDSNPARFLRYVCAKYFEGQDTVSEYEIAVEAFGRRPDFDSQKDAIVRVEAHRVRKRLREFYQGAGASRKYRLVIPPGRYLPVFTCGDTQAPAESESPAGRFASLVALSHSRLIVAVAVLVMGGVLGGVVLVHRVNRKPVTFPVAATVRTDTALPVPAVRIMAGSRGADYTDNLGCIWSADKLFDGGDFWRARYRRILRTADTSLFLNARQGSDFGYNIPLAAGLYELRLYFAETFFGEDNQDGGGESSRIFIVQVNGVPLLNHLDPLSDAGGSNTADVRVFKGISPAPDGELHLRFTTRFPGKAPAFVNAIEVTRTDSRLMLPIRWVASDNQVIDSSNRVWQPDQFCYGGRLRTDKETVTGTPDPEIYRSERYGNFSYAIPVAEGSYTLTLHFAEHWFGVEDRGLPNLRRFDVFCNGVTLLRDFAISSEAGGSLKALKKTFHRLKPNAQGKLLLAFVPIYDYATIAAVEVVDEGTH